LANTVSAGERNKTQADGCDGTNQSQSRPPQTRAVVWRTAAAAVIASVPGWNRRSPASAHLGAADRSAWSISRHEHLVRQWVETVAGSVCITKSRAAPGTPYSYGPWWTTGVTPPKLSCGGGVVVVHSSVVASHGLSLAFGP